MLHGTSERSQKWQRQLGAEEASNVGDAKADFRALQHIQSLFLVPKAKVLQKETTHVFVYCECCQIRKYNVEFLKTENVRTQTELKH